MTTYNLLTLVQDKAAGVEPLVADTPEQAIAFAAGMLTERVKGHEAFFVSSGAHWLVDCDDRDILDVTTPTGDQLGTFKLIDLDGELRVQWSPRTGA